MQAIAVGEYKWWRNTNLPGRNHILSDESNGDGGDRDY
jgi:hypothetical protein